MFHGQNGWTKQFEKVSLEKELKKSLPSYVLLSLVLVSSLQSVSKATPFRNLKLSYFSVTHSLVPAPWMLSKRIARVTGARKYHV